MSKKAHILRDEAESDGLVSDLLPVIRADAVAREAERRLPAEALGLIAESGLLALNVPAAFGGIEARAETIVPVCRRIAQADSSVARYFQPHFAAVDVVSRVGDEGQRSLFFSEVLDGAPDKSSQTVSVKRGMRTCNHRLLLSTITGSSFEFTPRRKPCQLILSQALVVANLWLTPIEKRKGIFLGTTLTT